MIITINRFLNKCKYNILIDDLRLQLLSHPDYPSFRAVTDTLDYFGVKNMALEVPKSALSQLPGAFLAQVHRKEAETVLVEQKKHGIKLITDQGKPVTMPVAEFEQIWDGAIIAVEPSEKPTERTENFSFSTFISVGILLIIAIGLQRYQTTGYFQVVYGALALAGLLLSIFSISGQPGFEALHQFCKGGCSAAPNMQKDSFLARLPLNDMALVYFAYLTLSLSLGSLGAFLMQLLPIVVLPVIAVSLYSQWRITKQWCTLCMGLNMILAGMAALVVFQEQSLSFDAFEVFRGVFLGGVMALFWYVLRQAMANRATGNHTQLALTKIKRDPGVFATLMNQTQRVEDNCGQGNIILGDPEAPLTLIAVTNPYCGYCQQALAAYQRLLHQSPGIIKIALVFKVKPDADGHNAAAIAGQLLYLYHNVGSEQALKALNDWFVLKDTTQWGKRYGWQGANRFQGNLEENYNWCMRNQIYYTPLSIVAGRVLPEAYQVEDIPLLAENFMKLAAQDKTPNSNNIAAKVGV